MASRYKKVGVDRDEMLDLIDELKGALPYELDTALKIIKEQDSILESARNDADFLREEAKREREQKIRECNDEIIIKNKQVVSEIESMMKEATIRAEELVSESKINKDAYSWDLPFLTSDRISTKVASTLSNCSIE